MTPVSGKVTTACSDELPALDEVLGRSTSHLSPLSDTVLLHAGTLPAFAELRACGLERGIDLAVASGYRSFERQQLIWNAKARGERAVLDDAGQSLDLAALSERDRVFAILRWSALPGASRHHWGTDMDIWDRAAVPGDYVLQLVPEEYARGGPFAHLDAWLNSDEVAACGFFRPYREDRGGVAAEPWHLSHRPLARRFARCLTRDQLAETLRRHPIELADTVLAHLDEIYQRFVLCPA